MDRRSSNQTMPQTPPRSASTMADLSTPSPPLREDSQPSMLYSMLPSPVQRRLPRVPSIRRSFSTYSMRANEDTAVARRSGTGSELDFGFIEDSSVATSVESSPCRSRSSISMTPPSPARAPLGREMRHAAHGNVILPKKTTSC